LRQNQPSGIYAYGGCVVIRARVTPVFALRLAFVRVIAADLRYCEIFAFFRIRVKNALICATVRADATPLTVWCVTFFNFADISRTFLHIFSAFA
jgi:hypothetical protein